MIRSIRFSLVVIPLLAVTFPANAMNMIAQRWRESSRLTPLEAVRVLELDARGAAVVAEELFEAEKHLRTDGPVSPSEYVVTELYGRLLRRQLGLASDDPSVRVERPLLHWLESKTSAFGVELRGHSVQIALQTEASDRIVVRLRDRTIEESWDRCGAELCVTATLATPPIDGRYVWAKVSGAPSRMVPLVPSCERSESPRKDLDIFVDPLGTPNTVTREIRQDGTASTACVFDDRSLGPVRISYLAAGTLAAPPARAAAGALVNNPMELRLFE